MTKKKKADVEDKEVNIEQKLFALYGLQQIDTQIDKIKIIRGELPLEVEDLEDEIAGLETRIEKYIGEAEEFKTVATDKRNAIKNSETLIGKYKEQQMNVRNNREYDSLTKELEFQQLEIELSEKKIKEAEFRVAKINEDVTASQEQLTMRKEDLAAKKDELTEIIAETKKEEQEFVEQSKKHEKNIEDRLLTAYKRIRSNARNGLAVVHIERDACGGCFNKIPPQHQLDIRMHKKIIVCEYCGRILVDNIIKKEETEA